MAIGAIIGGSSFFSAYWIHAYWTGFTEDKVNPYIQGLPKLGSIVSAGFGIVIGAVVSLISRKWKK